MSNIREKHGLIFNKEDIYRPTNILVKLLRKIFYDNKITYEYVDEVTELYYKQHNASVPYLSIAKSNLRNAILNENVLTWKTFEKILDIVLNGLVIEIDIKVMFEKSETTDNYSIIR